jgi:coiled-coil domain-containing protein 130
MPFHVWCVGCGELIGKGVRFNAEKQQTGTYLSSRIWSFTMRHHCGCKIVVRTDPKLTEYVVEEGARRKVRAPICFARGTHWHLRSTYMPQALE